MDIVIGSVINIAIDAGIAGVVIGGAVRGIRQNALFFASLISHDEVVQEE